jgi:hypothetical protein
MMSFDQVRFQRNIFPQNVFRRKTEHFRESAIVTIHMYTRSLSF